MNVVVASDQGGVFLDILKTSLAVVVFFVKGLEFGLLDLSLY